MYGWLCSPSNPEERRCDQESTGYGWQHPIFFRNGTIMILRTPMRDGQVDDSRHCRGQ